MTPHISLIAVIANAIVILLLAPLLDGVVRKIIAVVHSRKGPPITQGYIDMMKLLGKEDLRCTGSLVFRYGPAFALAAFIVVAALTPLGALGKAQVPGDVIIWIYFLTLGAAAIIVVAAASGNTFAQAGGAREIMMLLSVEPIVVVALIIAVLKSGSLRLGDMAAWNLEHGPTISMLAAGITFLLALQPTLGRLPFDIAEAESEIVDGPLVEVSGPNLAVMKLALMLRQLVYGFIVVQIFVPWPAFGSWFLGTVSAFVKVLILFALVAVFEAVNPRLRMDQVMSYMGRVLFVALAAVAFAMIGV